MTITYNYKIITVPDVFSVSKHPGLHGFHWSFSEAYPLVEVQVPIPIVLTWTTDHHWPVSATFSRVYGKGVICGRMAIQKRIEKWCTTIINNLPANFNDQAARLVVAKSGSNPVLYYSSRLIQLLLQPCSDMNTLMIEMQDAMDAIMYAHHSNIPCNFFRGIGSAPGALRAKEIQGTASFLQLLPLLWAPFSQTCHSTPQELSAGMRWQSANGVWQIHKNALTKLCILFILFPSLLFIQRYIVAQGKISIVFFRALGRIFPNPKRLAKYFQVSSYFSSFASSSFSRSAMRSWSAQWVPMMPWSPPQYSLGKARVHKHSWHFMLLYLLWGELLQSRGFTASSE